MTYRDRTLVDRVWEWLASPLGTSLIPLTSWEKNLRSSKISSEPWSEKSSFGQRSTEFGPCRISKFTLPRPTRHKLSCRRQLTTSIQRSSTLLWAGWNGSGGRIRNAPIAAPRSGQSVVPSIFCSNPEKRLLRIFPSSVPTAGIPFSSTLCLRVSSPAQTSERAREERWRCSGRRSIGSDPDWLLSEARYLTRTPTGWDGPHVGVHGSDQGYGADGSR